MTDREFYLMVSRDMDVHSTEGCKVRSTHHESHSADANDRVRDASAAMEVS